MGATRDAAARRPRSRRQGLPALRDRRLPRGRCGAAARACRGRCRRDRGRHPAFRSDHGRRGDPGGVSRRARARRPSARRARDDRRRGDRRADLRDDVREHRQAPGARVVLRGCRGRRRCRPDRPRSSGRRGGGTRGARRRAGDRCRAAGGAGDDVRALRGDRRRLPRLRLLRGDLRRHRRSRCAGDDRAGGRRGDAAAHGPAADRRCRDRHAGARDGRVRVRGRCRRRLGAHGAAARGRSRRDARPRGRLPLGGRARRRCGSSRPTSSDARCRCAPRSTRSRPRSPARTHPSHRRCAPRWRRRRAR